MFLQLLKSAHFYKTWAHLFVAAACALFLGAGVSVSGGIIAGAAAALLLSGLTLFGGFGATITSRSIFGLLQVGRLLQLATFLVAGVISAYLTALVLPVTVTSYLCIASTLIVFYLLLAIPTGHISQYAKRSWLPVKMPNR